VGGAAASALDHTSQAIITLAMRNVFLAGLAVLAIGFITTAMVPAARLRGRGPTLAEDLEAAAPASPTTVAALGET
jgi:hypothetical protein